MLDEIAKLWAQGVITEEIARRLKTTKGSVCRKARDARLKGDPRFPARGRFDLTKHKETKPPTPTIKVNPNLFDLLPNQCKYPVRSEGERGEEHYFCAEPRTDGSPYCREHDALCLNTTRKAGAFTTWLNANAPLSVPAWKRP